MRAINTKGVIYLILLEIVNWSCLMLVMFLCKQKSSGQMFFCWTMCYQMLVSLLNCWRFMFLILSNYHYVFFFLFKWYGGPWFLVERCMLISIFYGLRLLRLWSRSTFPSSFLIFNRTFQVVCSYSALKLFYSSRARENLRLKLLYAAFARCQLKWTARYK